MVLLLAAGACSAAPEVPLADIQRVLQSEVEDILRCQQPDGSFILLPFVPGATGYPIANRCNVNQGIGCATSHATVDTIAVKITYQYVWITPFPGMIGGSTTGPRLTSTNIMRLEPVR